MLWLALVNAPTGRDIFAKLNNCKQKTRQHFPCSTPSAGSTIVICYYQEQSVMRGNDF